MPEPRPSILFVDDDQDVLEGLADSLRRDRKRWNMVFANGGSRALDELAKAPFDIVVTDMRMPGMDGAELLGRVKAAYPTVTRLVLSGHSNRDALMRAVGVAHQFLAKPCDAATLRSTLERTHALRTCLDNARIKEIVGGITQLPSVPRTYLELTEVSADPSKGLADMARVIERDPAMSTKVLQLVNSSYFGSRREVRSVQQAVGFLGVELLKGLVLTAHAFASTEELAIPGFSIDDLQRYAMASARLAKRICIDPQRADEAFTATLVHDIGKIVLAVGFPGEVARPVLVDESLCAAETRLFGVTHAEVGAYLLGLWGLPFPIVEAAAYHHAPSRVAEGHRDVLGIVHVADALIDNMVEGGKTDRLDRAFVEGIGWASKLPEWTSIAEDCLREIGVS